MNTRRRPSARRRLLWSIVLPMSRPIIGVVSVFAILIAWCPQGLKADGLDH